MPQGRILLLTLVAMIAFAGNSLLCRVALKLDQIDAASFSSIRIISGALVLWLIVRIRGGHHISAGNWPSALVLFSYMASFSFAYISLPVATGALVLFGAAQATMIGYGLWTGEHLKIGQVVGLIIAFGGLLILLAPGISAPPLYGSILMLWAGASWGIYCLLGKFAGDPILVTAGNFRRAGYFALGMSAALLPWASIDRPGFWCAFSSGALASGLGYVIWYAALRGLKVTSAATAQLSVPVIAALGGIALLGEPVSLRLFIASTATLGGIAWAILDI
ncbi:MAG: DMT family transporter [Deltaproteobacteria bacterium]|nr:DMT family transporter [Deltaproteobacteria bacterium]